MRLRGLLLTGIAVMVVAVTGTLLVLHEDASVHADILIDRPPADVWKVVSTSAAYPDWNPFITRVDGDFRTGETIRIVLGVGPDSMVFKPTVLVVHPDHDLGGVAVCGFAASSTGHIAFTSRPSPAAPALSKRSLFLDCSLGD